MKMRNKKLLAVYLILAHLMWGILMWSSNATLIQTIGGYLFIWFMVLYMREAKKNDNNKG